MYAEYLDRSGLLPVCLSTAADALALAPSADVIVTAILLPGQMDGLEFVARLRRSDDTKRLPIVVLTSAAWDTERARAERAGCDVFLPKPCLPDQLLRVVRRLLATARLQKVAMRSAKADLGQARRKPARRHHK